MSEDSKYNRSVHELVPGWLRGYRGWRLHLGDVLERDISQTVDTACLKACVYPELWSAERPTVALCKLTPTVALRKTTFYGHPAPMHGCTCGIYALHSIDYDSYNVGVPINALFMGSIKAHGKAIIGSLGFKAQYAQVEALCPTPRVIQEAMSNGTYPILIEIGRNLAAKYGAQWFPSLHPLLGAFPPIPVGHLLPPPDPPQPDSPQPDSPQLIIDDDYWRNRRRRRLPWIPLSTERS